jgi:diguanylate cyclase (GGDEF)-like protein/PAS domain S-box-containing protein/putative nucleotidyltransferase with HDIG domain
VAGDDAEVRRLLAATLDRAGYRVVEAAGGDEVLAAAGRLRPELVILGVPLPGLDGPEVTRRLRGGPGAAPAILAVRGAGAETGVGAGPDAAPDASLRTPFSPRELLETARRLTAERDARKERDYSSALLELGPDATVIVDEAGRIVMVNGALERLFGYRREEVLGEPLELLLPERMRGRHREHRAHYAGAPRARTMGSGLNLLARRRNGGEFAVDVSLGPLERDGERLVMAAVRDVTERRHAEAEERALARVATAVASEARPEEVFALVAEEAAGLLGGQIGRVARFEGEAVRVLGTWGDEAVRVGAMLPADPKLAVVRVARTGRAARVDDYPALRRGDPGGGAALLAAHRSSVAAPVRVEGRLWGAVVVVSTSRERAFAPGVEGHLERFCGLVGMAVANAEHRAALARGVAEQTALREVATLVASDSQPRAVFALVAEQAARVLDADCGTVTRFDDGGRGRVVGSWTPCGGGGGEPGAPLRLDGRHPTGLVARTGTAARVDAAAAIAEGGETTCAGGEPCDSGLACPVRVDGRLWGAVAVAVAREDPLAPDAEDRLRRFADLVALAVAGADAREQLKTLASTDHLTGLYNHRAFIERLGDEVQRARRHGRPLSLVVFDLDHFKLVNDTFGHDVGNRVLAEAARRLRDQVRGGEVLARVGGEEFAWILPETDGIGAVAAAERARAALSAAPYPEAGRITTSAGVCDLTEAGDAGQLFRLADMALYWAKSQGRDRVFRYARSALELLPAEEQARRLERARTLAAVRALAVAVDAKEPATQRHSERVADLAEQLALAAGWPVARASLLREAALVHDVGKIALPDTILLKPARLSTEEYTRVKEHADIGAQMVAEALSPEQAAWIRFHHERFDGGGYPAGLAGERIPEGARLLGLADAWDAMTAARPYGAPRPPSEALEECRRLAARQFCPRAVAALDRLWETGALPDGADANPGASRADDPPDPDLVALATALIRRCRTVAPVREAAVYRVTDRGALALVAAEGWPRAILDEWGEIPAADPGPLAEAVRSGAPRWLTSRNARLVRYPNLAPAHAAAELAAAALPLTAGGRVVAVVGLTIEEPEDLTEVRRRELLAVTEGVSEALAGP